MSVIMHTYQSLNKVLDFHCRLDKLLVVMETTDTTRSPHFLCLSYPSTGDAYLVQEQAGTSTPD